MWWENQKMKHVIGGIAGTILLIIIIVIASEASESSDEEAIERTPIEAVANANTNFGNALFKILAKPAKNLIMSPYSVSLVLSMVLNGAEGTTASQLKQGLTLKNFDVVKNGFKDVLKLSKTNENFTLDTANRIYYSEDDFIAESYIQSTKEFFLAEPIGMNFDQSEQSRTEINQWVEGQTNKKIQELIPQGSIDASTKLILVNAIYFKGDFEFKFDKSRTYKEDFHVSPTQKVQTDMMHSTEKYGMLHSVTDLNGATALEIPYKGKRVSMIFLLPTIGVHSLVDLEEAISKVTDLNSILKFEQKSDVEVTLPRFKLESQLDLVEPLKQLGMTDMFDEAKADFSGMTRGANKGLFVSQVAQKAFIEVNEDGTEAAAATFVEFGETSLDQSSPPPSRFTCDRPFMFLIRDNLTGMILFSGHVTDPTK